MTGRTRTARFQPRRLRSAALLVFLLAISCAAGAADKDPLRPPDTSSPRATLQGFIGATDDAYSRMAGVFKSYGSSDRLFPSAEERGNQMAALKDAPKAMQFLDLSNIAPVLKETIAIERLLQLKEVLDRIDVPAFTEIPDAAAMAQLPSKRWRLPNTEIDIVLEDKGDRAGEYLVSAATIERLPEYYERVKDLPYKPGPGERLADLYRSISHGGAPTIYEAFLTSPIGLSYIIPPRWMLNLPDWARARIFGISTWQWLGISLGCVIAGLFIFGAHRVARRGAVDSQDEPSARWRALPVPVAILIVARLFVPFLATLLRIGGGPRAVIAYVSTVAVYVSAAWLTMVIAVVLGEAIVASEHLTARSLDSQLIRLGTRLLGLVGAIAILIQGGDELGFPAYSVLAGLGVGGLAVALAAQSTIANLIGSLLITMEKPFSVGHSVKIGGSEGTVVDVGFRSTRIRTADDSLVTIPSSSVVNATVENLSLRTKRRQRFVVQVTYDTSREKLEELVARIRQLIVDHPLAEDSTSRVRFNAFGESSLDILVMFHLQVADSDSELSEREAVLLQIMDIVKDLGLEFAFPTRTLQIGNANAGEKAPARPVQEASVVGFVSRT